MKFVQIASVLLFVTYISITSCTAIPKQRYFSNASIRQLNNFPRIPSPPIVGGGISNFPEDIAVANAVGGEDVITDDPEVDVTNMAHLIIIRKSDSSQEEATCTATVLSSRWLLTAAHCLAPQNGFSVSFEDTYTFIGETNSTLRIGNTNIRPYRFKRFLIHKNYNPQTVENGSDIAMVEIDRNIASNRYSSVDIARTAADDPKVNETVIAAGYGLTQLDFSAGVEFSTTLQKAPLDIRAFDECKAQSPVAWQPFLSDEKLICAGSSSKGTNGPTDTCIGDSGGPLFRERSGNSRSVQVAITSLATTFACAQPNTRGWYTRVSEFYEAITQARNNRFDDWKVTSS